MFILDRKCHLVANSDSLDLGDIYQCEDPASNGFRVIALAQSICIGVGWESIMGVCLRPCPSTFVLWGYRGHYCEPFGSYMTKLRAACARILSTKSNTCSAGVGPRSPLVSNPVCLLMGNISSVWVGNLSITSLLLADDVVLSASSEGDPANLGQFAPEGVWVSQNLAHRWYEDGAWDEQAVWCSISWNGGHFHRLFEHWALYFWKIIFRFLSVWSGLGPKCLCQIKEKIIWFGLKQNRTAKGQGLWVDSSMLTPSNKY